MLHFLLDKYSTNAFIKSYHVPDLLGIEKGTLSLTLQELEIFADSHMLKEYLQK